MTIDEAIENLRFLSTAGAPNLRLNDIDAIKLGIEALQNKLEARRYGIASSSILLPGETKKQ